MLRFLLIEQVLLAQYETRVTSFGRTQKILLFVLTLTNKKYKQSIQFLNFGNC